MTDIDKRALDSLSVAPSEDANAEANGAAKARTDGRDPRQEAGQDSSIAERLQADPTDSDARLDNALDESMDASDPLASTQPVHSTDPAPSSGYDADAERALADKKD